ncbi:hypothetical protein D3C81_972640 [compost metagenome]
MKTHASQTGMALLVSLVLLLLLTIIAITAATQSSLQERMAANSQQQNVAFQTAESGIQGWIEKFNRSQLIVAMSTDKVSLTPTVSYTASAAKPSDCTAVMPPFSLSANEDGAPARYACFNIESTGKSCADADCADANNPARAKHQQGHLVRYF